MRRALVLILIAAGGLLVAASLVEAALTARYVARAQSATGVVVAIESVQSGGSRSEVSTFPVVEYIPGGDARRRFRGEGAGGRDYRVGDEVEVRFLPGGEDPRIAGAAGVWGRTAGLLFAGVLLLLPGLLGRQMLNERLGEDPELEEA
jgi:hypothetical protein